jgi:uncharacterized protein YdhG (YjbR/CyaY superfamily)
MSASTGGGKSGKGGGSRGTGAGRGRSASAAGFTAEEKAAMKARVQEMKAEARAGRNREEGEAAVRAAIGRMKEPDRSLAQRFHDLDLSTAPVLVPRTWYGMPAYANPEGKVICFFQAAGKFKVRYATFGFQHDARLDDGNMWPTGFALVAWTPAEAKRIAALVRQAVGG